MASITVLNVACITEEGDRIKNLKSPVRVLSITETKSCKVAFIGADGKTATLSGSEYCGAFEQGQTIDKLPSNTNSNKEFK